MYIHVRFERFSHPICHTSLRNLSLFLSYFIPTPYFINFSSTAFEHENLITRGCTPVFVLGADAINISLHL